MATIQKFEDLEVWQMLRRFTLSIFYLTLTDKFVKEHKFKAQIKSQIENR